MDRTDSTPPPFSEETLRSLDQILSQSLNGRPPVDPTSCLPAELLVKLAGASSRNSLSNEQLEHLALCPACRDTLRELHALAAADRARAPRHWWHRPHLGTLMLAAAAAATAGIFLWAYSRPRPIAPPLVAVHPSPRRQIHPEMPGPSPRPKESPQRSSVPQFVRVPTGPGSHGSGKPALPRHERRFALSRPHRSSELRLLIARADIQERGGIIYEHGARTDYTLKDFTANRSALEALPEGSSRRSDTETPTAPPQVQLTAPAIENQSLADTRPQFEVTLQDAMSAEPLNAQSAKQLIELNDGDNASVAVHVEPHGDHLTITPATPLERGHEYQLKVHWQAIPDDFAATPPVAVFAFRILSNEQLEHLRRASRHPEQPVTRVMLLWNLGRFADALKALDAAPPNRIPHGWRALIAADLARRRIAPDEIVR